MFFRKKVSKEEQQREWDKQLYESAVERLYKYGRTALAIASYSHWEGYNAKGDASGAPMPSPSDFMMNGVVHEQTMYEKRIWCQVRFDNEIPMDDFVGSCFLTHVDADKPKLLREKQRLLFEVWISDPTMEWRQRAYEHVRDAALSNAQFCHFTVQMEKLDSEAAVMAVREKGYGPSMKVRSFSMQRQIVLPKAPEWGWKSVYEQPWA